MKRRTIIILSVIAVIALVGFLYGYKEYNRGHTDLQNGKSDVTLTAQALVQEFTTDEAAANKKYLDKAVELTGVVQSLTKDESGNYTIMLESGNDMTGISCEMDERHNSDAASVKPGDQIRIKGMCTGVLMDVVLVRCVIVK